MKMMKMKTMISKPNYKRAELAAHKLLQLNNIQELPVKVKKLSNKFPNLKIKSYSWFANKRNMTIEEVCDFANSDEGCCYYQKSTNLYLILYNDKVNNTGRIRWTIAHELGHFMLKHNEKSNRTILGRSSLSDSEYEIFEKEANCFARELLAPQTVITKLGKISIPDIQYLCGMSVQAASNVISFLNTGQQMGFGHTFNTIIAKMFSGFIYKISNKHYCAKCRHEFVSESPSYCPICANTRISKTFYSYGGDNDMKYNGYEVDDMGRAFECPRCGNEELLYDGEHCKICGITLINKCANQRFWNGEIEWECGTILDGNARYCIKCGNESTYYQQDLLDNWETERYQKEKSVYPF